MLAKIIEKDISIIPQTELFWVLQKIKDPKLPRYELFNLFEKYIDIIVNHKISIEKSFYCYCLLMTYIKLNCKKLMYSKNANTVYFAVSYFKPNKQEKKYLYDNWDHDLGILSNIENIYSLNILHNDNSTQEELEKESSFI